MQTKISHDMREGSALPKAVHELAAMFCGNTVCDGTMPGLSMVFMIALAESLRVYQLALNMPSYAYDVNREPIKN